MNPADATAWLQEMSVNMPGTNWGMFAPQSTGGASLLSMTSAPGFRGGHAPGISGTPVPDMSPLAPFNLGQYGLPGLLVGMAANPTMAETIRANGMTPMGNSGSLMQAHRAQEYRQMQVALAGQVGGQDAEGYYRTIRGAAALTGQPFNRKQREAARDLSSTLASWGPTLAMTSPELLDAIAGERGSVQAMSAQMSEANRYRLDPNTGKMGYSTESNKELIGGVFDTMFSQDNMVKMHGLRAGDVGQMYRGLAAEGLVGSRGNLRDRTLSALKETQAEGGSLQALGKSVNVALADNTNLETISNVDLEKLRKNQDVKSKLSSSDAKQISGQLQNYVDSISAMREVFGENGDLGAPVPKLINALKMLSAGQMQRFDASQLNNMVREVQALSQTSGKSIDQLVAMKQSAGASNNAMVGQAHGLHFNQAALNVGTTTGMAVRQAGAAVGFGADSPEQSEQKAMRLFSRGLASETGNMMGVLTRLEQGGGFDATTAAGRNLKNILAATDAGETTYKDDAGNMQKIPTTAAAYRQMVSDGGVKGLSGSTFNMMISQKTSNLRALSESPQRQQTAFDNQRAEINRFVARDMGLLLSSDAAFSSVKGDQKAKLNQALGTAAAEALDSLSPEQVQDTTMRNETMANALTKTAKQFGVTLDLGVAKNLAVAGFGQSERTVGALGFDSWTSFAQVHGKEVTEKRKEAQALVRNQAGLNQTMAELGPQGSMLQRVISAVQKQGDTVNPDFSTLLADILGAGGTGDKDTTKQLGTQVTGLMAKVKEHEDLMASMTDATPAEKKAIQQKIDISGKALRIRVNDVATWADARGLKSREGKFDLTDAVKSEKAGAAVAEARQLSLAQFQASISVVSEKDLKAAADTTVTEKDFTALAAFDREQKLKAIDGVTAAGLTGEDATAYAEKVKGGMEQGPALTETKKGMKAGVETVEAGTARIKGLFGTTASKVGALSPEQQKAVELSRRVAKAKAGDAAGPIEHTEENRIKVREQMQATGKEVADKVRDDLDTQNKAREEFVNDAAAVKRGGAEGIAAANASREHSKELDRLSADYYGGDQSKALLFGGVNMTDAGKEQALREFEKLTPEDKQAVRKQLTAVGIKVGAELTDKDFLKSIALRTKAAGDGMEAAGKVMKDKGLLKTDNASMKQQEAMKKAVDFDDATTTAGAKELGIDVTQYQAIVRGDEVSLLSSDKLLKSKEEFAKIKAQLVDSGVPDADVSKRIDAELKARAGGIAASKVLKAAEASAPASKTSLAKSFGIADKDKTKFEAGLKDVSPVVLKDVADAFTAVDKLKGTETASEKMVTFAKAFAALGQEKDPDPVKRKARRKALADTYKMDEKNLEKHGKTATSTLSAQDAEGTKVTEKDLHKAMKDRSVVATTDVSGKDSQAKAAAEVDRTIRITSGTLEVIEKGKAILTATARSGGSGAPGGAGASGVTVTKAPDPAGVTGTGSSAGNPAEVTASIASPDKAHLSSQVSGVSTGDLHAKDGTEAERTIRITGGAIEVRGEIVGLATLNDVTAVLS